MLDVIVDRINVGIFTVDKHYNVVLWNRFMENHSEIQAKNILGKNLFDTFPSLPRDWFERKINNVFILKNYSFTNWEYRPFLFDFPHNRPITGGVDNMRQNCTFVPIKGTCGEIQYVCITIFDVTDISLYQDMLKNAMKSLAEASNRDGLTNIYNRRFFEYTLSQEFDRAIRYGSMLSFIIIDLDFFKLVNDTHGHLAGDEVLKETAKRIQKALRTADTCARYGGEEFAIILPETPLQGAVMLAERLRKTLASQPIEINGRNISVTASIGVAQALQGMKKHKELIEHADAALYQSKENGRNLVTLATIREPKEITYVPFDKFTE